ncbi:MAG: hypothetical protein V9E94_00860 [Microthrixaceae bacterium]
MFDELETAAAPATACALTASCVDAANDAVAVAARLPVDGLDGPQLRELSLQLERMRRALDATQLHALAELDRRRHTDLRRGAATSKWLADKASLPAGVARAAGAGQTTRRRPSARRRCGRARAGLHRL